MNKIKVCIWGRDFELPVVYQNYPGEDITENQQNTCKTIPMVDYNAAKLEVIKYVKKFFTDDNSEDELTNIFRFVMPTSIVVPRADDSRIFAIMCKFKLDMEHGIGIIFENAQFKETGPQDLIL